MAFPINPTANQIYKEMIYDIDRWRRLNKIISLGTWNYDITANIPLAVFNLGSLHNGTYIIDIKWDAFHNVSLSNTSNETTVIWGGNSSGTLSCYGASQVYNATPAIPINLNSMVHHTSIALPTFTVDSDNLKGSYGDSRIYMTTSFSGCVIGITASVRELL